MAYGDSVCFELCCVQVFSCADFGPFCVCVWFDRFFFPGCFLQVFIIADLALGFVKRADILALDENELG